ncbi:uncharacterized protein LOC17874408 [Capsella rubella]|nr:uncharacterized protein LOC17874408 [Capsella rubella]
MVETRRSSSASKRLPASSPETTSSSSRPTKRSKAAAEPAASSSASEVPVENRGPVSDPGSESGEPERRTPDPQTNGAERPVTTADVPAMETDTIPEVEGLVTPTPAVVEAEKSKSSKKRTAKAPWAKLISQCSQIQLAPMDVMVHSSSFLLPYNPAEETKYALVVLNQNLPRFTPLLWEHATLRLCADGGANRIYDELPLFFPHEDASSIRNRYKPDVIKGDMDSIRRDVLDFYVSLGTQVIDESHDQDTTDLDKCILYIRDSASSLESSRVSSSFNKALCFFFVFS